MPIKPIKILVPGSKSISNRVLVLAALSSKKITIKNIGLCDDVKYMVKALKLIFKRQKNPIKIFTGNAGTTTRFLTALATLTSNTIIISGDKRMNERPIQELTSALNRLGAKVKDNKGCPPLTIFSQKLQGGEISIPGNISSQFLSSILMTAPFGSHKTIIKITDKLVSKPYIKMTIKLLQQFGIKIVNKKFAQFEVIPNQKIKAPEIFEVESDASSASYPATYAALHPKQSVLLENIRKNSIQGDIKFLDYLKKMGCKIAETKSGITIQGPKTLKSLKTIDMNETPDLVMTFAVLAMFTNGTTKITNIENLRVKETDRLQALKNEIEKFGIEVNTGKDYIEITGNKLLMNKKFTKKIIIETYNDHRIAMSFSIINDILPLKIKNPNCVSKSYETFWKDLKKLQNGN